MASSAPRRYADGTQVPVERTRAELEKLLTAHGATAFGVFKEPERTVVMYRLRERYIKHVMRVAEPPKGRGTKGELERRVESEERRRWRALLLIIKAKLEVIAAGDSTVEREFMADTMLADGSTVYDHAAQQIADSYATGQTPTFLLGAGK
jgi:hypothetical protein